MDRAGALPCERRFRKGLEVDRVRTIAAGHDEAGDVALCLGTLITHETEQFGRGSGVVQAEPGTGETPDTDAFVYAGSIPCPATVIVCFDKGETFAIRSLEEQAVSTEGRVCLKVAGSLCRQAVLPEGEGALGHRRIASR